MPAQDIASALRGAGRIAQALRGAQTLARLAQQIRAGQTEQYQPGGGTSNAGGGDGGGGAAPVVSTLASIPDSPLKQELITKGLLKEGMPVEQALAILQLGQMRGGVAIDIEALMKEIQADYENYSGDIFGDSEQWMKDLYGAAQPNPNDPNSAMFKSDPIWADTAGGLSQMEETAEQNLQTDLNWFRKQQEADQAYYDQMMSGISTGTIPMPTAEAGGGGGGGGGGGRGYRRGGYGGGGGSSGGDDVRNTMQIDDTFQTTAKDQYYENFPGFYRDMLAAASGTYDLAANPEGYTPEILDMFRQAQEQGITPERIEELQFLLDTSGDPAATQQAMAERIRELTEESEGWSDTEAMNRQWRQQAPAEWMDLLQSLEKGGYTQGDNPFTGTEKNPELEPLTTEYKLPFGVSATGLEGGFMPAGANNDELAADAERVNEAIASRLGGQHYNMENITGFLQKIPRIQELAQAYLGQNQPAAVGGAGSGNTQGDVNNITDIAERLAASQGGAGLAPLENWPQIIQDFDWGGGQPNAGDTTTVEALPINAPDIPYDPLSSARVPYNVDSSQMGDVIANASESSTSQPIGVNPWGQPIYDLVNPAQTSDVLQNAIRTARNVLPFQDLRERAEEGGFSQDWLRDAIRSRMGLPMDVSGPPSDQPVQQLYDPAYNDAMRAANQVSQLGGDFATGDFGGGDFSPSLPDNYLSLGGDAGFQGISPLMQIIDKLTSGAVVSPTPDGGVGQKESAHDRWLMMNAMADNGMSVEDAIARMHGDKSVPLSPEYQATARWPNPPGLTVGGGGGGGSGGVSGFSLPGMGGLNLTGMLAQLTQSQQPQQDPTQPQPGQTSPYDIVGATRGAQALSNAAKIATMFNAQQQRQAELPEPEQGQSFAEFGEANWDATEGAPAARLNAIDAATAGSSELNSQNLLNALMGRVAFDKSGLLRPEVETPLAMRNYGKYTQWMGDMQLTPEEAENVPYPHGGPEGVHYQPQQDSVEDQAARENLIGGLKLFKDMVAYGWNPDVSPSQVYSSYQEQNRQNVQGERYLRDFEPGTTQGLAVDPQQVIQDMLSGLEPEQPENYDTTVQLGLSGGTGSGLGAGDYGMGANFSGLANKLNQLGAAGQSTRNNDSVFKLVNAASELRSRQAQQAATAAAAARRVGQATQGIRNVGRATQTATNLQGAMRGVQRIAEVLRRLKGMR